MYIYIYIYIYIYNIIVQRYTVPICLYIYAYYRTEVLLFTLIFKVIVVYIIF